MSVIINTARKSISTWLRANGVDPKGWAPWVTMDHYLSRKGTNLDLSSDKLIVGIAAWAINQGEDLGEGKIGCFYNTERVPMQTKTPYLGSLGHFNELTATVGGFTAVDKGDHYLIVDRYDWYDTNVLIELPPCVRPLVDAAPKWLKEKLNIKGYYLNQGAMPQLGVAFDTIIRVPKNTDYNWLELKENKENKNFTNIETLQETLDWGDVLVSEEVAEANKDQTWSRIGDTWSPSRAYELNPNGLVVIADDIYGGYAMAAELCCLLEDKPPIEDIEDDFELDEFCEFRIDGLYVVYEDEDWGYYKPIDLPYSFEGFLKVEACRLRRIKKRNPESYKALLTEGWATAESLR